MQFNCCTVELANVCTKLHNTSSKGYHNIQEMRNDNTATTGGGDCLLSAVGNPLRRRTRNEYQLIGKRREAQEEGYSYLICTVYLHVYY